MTYQEFLTRKSQIGGYHGFSPVWMPDFLFDFQKSLVEWALQKGRAAIFADCGLGKTPMQLVWAENVIRHTGGKVLIVTPLAVSHQTCREGEKFDIEVRRSDNGEAYTGITVTNYERLDRFNAVDFVGTVCDESSAIKSFAGKRRAIVTDFMKKQRYRLLATATAAPNDYIELGTSSEALGYLGYVDMLGRFFVNDTNPTCDTKRRFHGDVPKFRFRGHAEIGFWKWVASWARAIRKPSDYGYDDNGFLLPPLQEEEHIVNAQTLRPGFLFELPAIGLQEEREEQRRTIKERCERVANIVNKTNEPAVIWCNLNDEGKLLDELIPDGVEVAGSDTDDHKEQSFLRFVNGEIRVLITKPKIGAWGLNWQHCHHETFFPSHSYESYYQAVRRCWRFGQKMPVTIDIVTTPGGHNVMQNLKRKAVQADTMFTELVAHMNDAIHIDSARTFTKMEEVPKWLLPISA